MPKKKTLREQYQQTMQRSINTKKQSITIITTEDTYDKAISAFNFAVAAVEMGMSVSMFFTARGVNIVKKTYKPRRAKWGEAPIGWKESFIKRRGGATLAQLMYQAKDMGVQMQVCYTSMISMGIHEQSLIDGISVKRMPEFLQSSMQTDTHLLFG